MKPTIIYQRNIEPVIETNGLDKSLLRKKGTAKTFLGWILARMQDYRKERNFEMALVMETVYKKGLEFQTSEKVKINSWKGKSGIKLLELPSKFICITYKKDEKDSEPKESKKEIEKSDLNNLIVVLNTFKDKDKIPTSEIAEKLHGKNWKLIFSDRQKHIELTYMLNILEQKGKIKYSRRGFTKIIKNLDYFCCK